MAQSASTGNYLLPKTIQHNLNRYSINQVDLPFQFFKGILNFKLKRKKNQQKKIKGSYCYVISFLQLFIHCEDVLQYIKNQTLTNKNEKLLSRIIDEIDKNENKKAIDIFDFIRKWKGWEGRRKLPSRQSDSCDFGQFFLNSLTKDLYNLFKIKSVFTDEMELEKGDPFHKKFFLKLVINSNNIQNLINEKMKKCQDPKRLPKYLFLSILRYDGFGFNDKYIDINTFIHINNINYQFFGASIFQGQDNEGHYTTIIKFDDKHILFDDDNVIPLFVYQGCNRNVFDIAQRYNSLLNKNCRYLLYKMYDGDVDFNLSENIKTTVCKDPKSTSDSSVNVDQITLFQNALHYATDPNQSNKKKQIIKKSKKKMQKNDQSINLYTENSASFSAPRNIIQSESRKNFCLSNHKSANSTPKMQHTDHFSSFSDDLFLLSDSDSIMVSTYIDHPRHLLLKKEDVDVQSLKATDLKGIVRINKENTYYDQSKRIKDSQFAIYRTAFKIAGKILREMDFNDQGLTNAEILKNRLKLGNNDNEIQKQGNKVYQILKDVIESGDVNKANITNKLNPVLQWYQSNYRQKSNQYLNGVMNENSAKASNYISFGPKSLFFSLKFDLDPKKYIENIFDDIEFVETSSDSENDFIYSSESGEEDEYDYYYEEDEDEFEMDEEEDEFNKNKVEDEFDKDEEEEEEEEDSIQVSGKEDIETTNVNEKKEEKVNKDTDDQRKAIDMGEKNIENSDSCSSNFKFLTTLINIIQENNKYKDWHENNDECDCYDDDDNQTIIDFYDWRERINFFDANELVDEIRSRAVKKETKTVIKKSELRRQIMVDFYKKFLEDERNIDDINTFIKNYIEKNNNLVTMSENVRTYKRITGMDINKPIYTSKYLKSKLDDFIDSSYEQQRIKLESDPEKLWGGPRENKKKISDDSIKCLIALVLDFPTFSAKTYANYLNSPFGPNCDEKNHIHERTVQRYLKNLDITVKKCSFAPPNRNSIGLRIFRVAWCHFINDMISQDNVLLGFIDEAAVTQQIGRKYGRAYCGITPLVNCPLDRIKMTIIALVLPGFGVLYKFYSNSANSENYSEFLKSAVEFIRRYICNKDTEILFIEDNCPIHCTHLVEKTIEDLKIALIPTVAYSPALNGIAEGYFGFIKLKNILNRGATGETEVKNAIMQNWENISNELFTVEETHSLYYEWKLRMKHCLKGEPIISGHISEDDFKVNLDHLTNVTIDKLIEHQPQFFLNNQH